jgi:ceramide glucosyltransferase
MHARQPRSTLIDSKPSKKASGQMLQASFEVAGQALLVCALVGLASSTVFLMLVSFATLRFRLRVARLSRDRSPRPQPPVSVLKPVHGLEPGLAQCLETFFRQDYREYELVFGARYRDDGAWSVVNQLRKDYPDVRCKTIETGTPVYPNAKVSALEPMVASAAFQYLVIADSDSSVPSDCLAEVVRPLLDPGVGLVTCLYRGVSTGGLSSRLEALGMSVEMSSGVLVADMLEGMRFALGPTLAVRRDTLQTIGGVAVLGAYCADDYVLGQRIHAAGRTVVLSHKIIDHLAVNRSLKTSLAHQIRWMRSTRFSRPWGHLGAGLTFAMPFGLLGFATALISGYGALATALLSVAVANRVVQCVVVGWIGLRDRQALWWSWLYPVRDLLGFCVWCASFAGREVEWRGEHYVLSEGGRMRAI